MSMDPFDFLIAGDDAEVLAEIIADRDRYQALLATGDFGACAEIADKYGMLGVAPDRVMAELREMANPVGDA